MTSRLPAAAVLASLLVGTTAFGCGHAKEAPAQSPVAAGAFTPPKRKKVTRPPYPEIGRRPRVDADVTMMVNLDASGRVVKVQMIKESPYPEFNEVARKTAMAEEFEPATRGGVPVPFSVSFTYSFRLEEE